MKANTITSLEDEDSNLGDPSYAGMPGLVPRDTESSDDDLDDNMQQGATLDGTVPMTIHQMMTAMMTSMICQRAISMTS